ncbi:MAG: hypothetical protein V4615_15170, partial [Bacteroidota bacterium]
MELTNLRSGKTTSIGKETSCWEFWFSHIENQPYLKGSGSFGTKILFAFLISLMLSGNIFGQSNSCVARTQTQGGWGQCHRNGNNPGTYLFANFSAAFPSGLTVGCTNTLTLTSAQAVCNFLPSGTRPKSLLSNLTDPSQGYQNVLAGQVVALTLNVMFDQYDLNFGASTTPLADFVITTGTFAGWTVQQLLDEANRILGGCTSSYNASQINDAVSSVNENYVDGQVTGNFLTCCGLSMSACSHINIDCNNPTGSVTAGTITQASGTVSYEWRNSSNIIVGTTSTISGLPADTYTLTVSDSCSTATCTETITGQSSSINLTCSSTNVSSNGGSDGVVGVIVTGGNGPLTYLWNTGATTASLINVTAGTYSLTLTDSTTCSATITCTITEPTPTPCNANAGSDMLLTCNTTQLNLLGSTTIVGFPLAYNWTGPGILAGETTPSPTVNAPGTYIFSVTVNPGTQSELICSDTVLVTQDTTSIICNIGFATPTIALDILCDFPGGSGGNTISTTTVAAGYSWQFMSVSENGNPLPSGWAITSGQGTNMITFTAGACPSGGGANVSIMLIVTNNVGCSDTCIRSIQPVPFRNFCLVNAGPDTTLACGQASLTLSATYETQDLNPLYSWSGPGIVSGGNTPNVTVNASGTYIFVMTAFAGTLGEHTCTDTVNVNLSQSGVCSIIGGSAICVGDTNIYSAPAGTSYSWSISGSGTIIGSTTTQNISVQAGNVCGGNYILTLTVGDGNCSSTCSDTFNIGSSTPVLSGQGPNIYIYCIA